MRKKFIILIVLFALFGCLTFCCCGLEEYSSGNAIEPETSESISSKEDEGQISDTPVDPITDGGNFSRK